jgi:hypothetical protein
MKSCSNASCTETNPQSLDNFYTRENGKIKSRCKVCEKIKGKLYRIKYPEKNKEKWERWKQNNPIKFQETRKLYDSTIKRDKELQMKYGISLEQYNNMKIQQEYKCYICQRHEKEFKRSLAVDHCHKTGKVRALLCGHCNAALGNFYDSVELVEKAKQYLDKFNSI